MHIQPASPPSHHTQSPATNAVTPSEPFSSHLGNKTRKQDKSIASGGSSPLPTPPAASPAPPGSTTATAPSAASTTGSSSGTPTSSSVQSSIDSSDDDNMQMLQLQSQMDSQSEMFTTLSNVEKTETDTMKNTAQNMAI